jgi:hypothetical protein
MAIPAHQPHMLLFSTQPVTPTITNTFEALEKLVPAEEKDQNTSPSDSPWPKFSSLYAYLQRFIRNNNTERINLYVGKINIYSDEIKKYFQENKEIQEALTVFVNTVNTYAQDNAAEHPHLKL